MPIKIDRELKELKKFKKSNYQNIISEHLLAFVNTLKSINKLIILYRLIPSPILEKGAALEKQVINFSIL